MKKTTAEKLMESPFASLRAAETAYLNRTPTPIQQAAYRLATIAAPFAAAGASQESAILSAQKLMLACQRRLTSDAKVAAVLDFENPDLAMGRISKTAPSPSYERKSTRLTRPSKATSWRLI